VLTVSNDQNGLKKVINDRKRSETLRNAQANVDETVRIGES